ncbi:aldo/keto reductase [Dellaglioa sp. BT-FLS60]
MTTMQKELNMPKMVLGTWAWGDNGTVFGNQLTEKDYQPVFEAAMKNGLNLWDTAAVYGMGASETILGNLAQKSDRDKILFSTKFTPQIADGTDQPAENMIADSLKRLHTDYVDIYWIHNSADVEKWTPEMVSVMKSGKAKYLGVSNHSLAQIKRVQEILAQYDLKLSAVQNHFSLLNRVSETTGIIDYCQKNDMDFFAYMILEQGALSGKYDTAHPFPAGSDRANTYNDKLAGLESLITKMRELADNHQATVAEIGTAWAINKGTTPIIGVTSVGQVEDAVKSSQITLTADEMTELEKLADETGVNTVRGWE